MKALLSLALILAGQQTAYADVQVSKENVAYLQTHLQIIRDGAVTRLFLPTTNALAKAYSVATVADNQVVTTGLAPLDITDHDVSPLPPAAHLPGGEERLRFLEKTAYEQAMRSIMRAHEILKVMNPNCGAANVLEDTIFVKSSLIEGGVEDVEDSKAIMAGVGRAHKEVYQNHPPAWTISPHLGWPTRPQWLLEIRTRAHCVPAALRGGHFAAIKAL